MRVFRNGVENTSLVFDNHQLTALSLAIAANDAEIGMGSITVPGDPAWLAGDRISILEGSELLYTGYVMDHSRDRNRASPSEVETTYQLMDPNRQLIGRQLVDWTQPQQTSDARLTAFLGFLSDLTLTTSITSTSATMPAKVYSGDGVMDVLADLILYTGYTLWLAITNTENAFKLFFRDVLSGAVSDIQLSDVPADINNSTVFGITDPHVDFTAADLKNDITVRNGIDVVAGTNPTSITDHGAGGLKFQAVLDYNANQTSLVIFANSILDNAGDERATYTCSVLHLNGGQVHSIVVGQGMRIQHSTIFGLTGVSLRITHGTLTISRDEQGEPIPGYWDIALEMGAARRFPSAGLGFGGQGGDSGRLSDPLVVDHVTIEYDDPLIPAGSTTTVTGQLMTAEEFAVPTESVTVTWTLVQWEDEAGTIAGTDYSISPATSTTDISGLASTVVTHATDGATIKWWVEAST